MSEQSAAIPSWRSRAVTAAGTPDSLGGIRMAIYVAELAHAGMTPDWTPGVVPRCLPTETKSNQHGERAPTIVVGRVRAKTRGKWRTVELLACLGPLAATSGTDRFRPARQ